MLATAACWSMDYFRARCVCVASPSAGATRVSQTTGRLWRGRGTTAIQTPGAIQSQRGKQMAWGNVWHGLAGCAIGPTADLSRHVWYGHVSMSLPTGRVSLGYAAD